MCIRDRGGTYFARFQYIEPELDKILKEMKSELPKVSSMDEYAEKLAGYYLDINIAHPFREGNGRCEREFFREYVLHLNKVLKLPDLELDYSRMNKSMMMTAVIENNINIMKQEFMNALIKKEKGKTKIRRKNEFRYT